MSVGIDFYKMTKSVNSTRLPDANTETIHYSGTFKNGTNVLAPTVVLNASGGITYYNYCYIPAFDRYYFVINWTYVEGAFWEASLACDVMASLKSIIGASSQYVERAYSAFDEYVEDSLYPGLARAPIQSDFYDAGYNMAGSFVVGVSGAANGGATGGGTNYYVFNIVEMNNLMNMLFDSTSYSGLSGENVFYFNPFQYITSVRWYPITMLPAANRLPLNLGFYELIASAPVCSDVYYTPQVTITLPSHPQASARGRYLNAAPYSNYRLYLPCVGEMSISAEAISESNRQVVVDGVFDPITGTLVYHLKNAGVELALATGTFGVDIAVSQVSLKGAFSPILYNSWRGFVADKTHALGDLLQSIADVMPSGPATGLKENFGNLAFQTHQAASGVADSFRNANIQASISGQDGNRAMYYTNRNFILFSQFVEVAADDPERNGRPLMQRRTINTLTGFIKTQNAHIEGNGSFTLPECQRCEVIMNGGFYYE